MGNVNHHLTPNPRKCMSLDYGRKQGYTKKTWQVENFLLWGNSAKYGLEATQHDFLL